MHTPLRSSAVVLGLLGAAAWSPSAAAFCGTYVGGAGDLYNSASQVALSRFEGKTRITMANDVQGDTTDFAIVVPVPEIPSADDVKVIDPEVFSNLAGYSEPRLVSYECDDFYGDQLDNDAGGSGSDGGGGGWDTGGAGEVDVEARYIVGEYEVVILSASESDALVTWLQDNGYSVSDAASKLLQEYIDGGSYFFAAKVGPDAEIESGEMLSPLQFGYEADHWALPVRLGTLNSPGSQDLVVYVVNDYDSGIAGISNYDQAEIETDCLWEPEGEQSFEEFYAGRLGAAHEQEGANWVVEYSWGQLHCDPCTGTEPGIADIVALGAPQTNVENGDLWLSRLHLRYAPDEVSTALGFYHSGIQETGQQRYIEHQEWLQEYFPVCDQGMVGVEYNECLDEDGDGVEDHEEFDPFEENANSEAKGCAGCTSTGAPPPVGLLGLLGLAVFGLRRRS